METFVLVIDDSPTIRKIVEVSLQREGFAVQGCHDGIEAMRWLAQSHTIPALILLDINLPQMDGFEMARRITRIKPLLKPSLSCSLVVTACSIV